MLYLPQFKFIVKTLSLAHPRGDVRLLLLHISLSFCRPLLPRTMLRCSMSLATETIPRRLSSLFLMPSGDVPTA